MFDVDLVATWVMFLIFVSVLFGIGFVLGVLLSLGLTLKIHDKKRKLFRLILWGVIGGFVMVVGGILKEKFIR